MNATALNLGELANFSELTWTELAWTQFWQVTLTAAVALLAVRMFCRRRPYLAYALLMLVVIKCVVPPLWSSPAGLFSWVQQVITEPVAEPLALEMSPIDMPPTEEFTMSAARLAADSLPPETMPAAPVVPPLAEPSRPALTLPAWPALLLGVWAGGAALCALVITVGWYRQYRMIRHGCVPATGEVLALATQLATELRLRRRPRLWISQSSKKQPPFGPLCFGIVRPTIVLPDTLTASSSLDQLTPILAHELVHLGRRDTLAAAVQVWVTALWWFHPLVWLTARQLSRQRERCCDQAVVVTTGCAPEQYAQSVLNVLRHAHNLQPMYLASGIRPVDVTGQRLEAIMSPGVKPRARTPWFCWVAVALGATLLLPGKTLQVVASDAPTQVDESEVEQSLGGVPKATLAPGTYASERRRKDSDGEEIVGDEKLKVLEMLVAQMRGNYERIQTLQGSYRFDDRFRFSASVPGRTVSIADAGSDEPGGDAPMPLNDGDIPVGPSAGGGYWEITRGTTTFSLDTAARKHHAFYTPDKPVGFIDVATGEESRWRAFGDSIHWTFTPEHALAFHVDGGMGQIEGYPPVASVPPTGGRIVYKRTAETGKRFTRVVDVRDFYSNGSRPFWEWIGFYVTVLRGERSDSERELLENGLDIYLSQDPHPQYVIKSTYYFDGSQITTVCDGSAGFNVVSYDRVNADGKPLDTRKIRFREIDGVFVPDAFEFSFYDQTRPAALPRIKRSFELETIEVNKPIAESTFGIERFGLKHGERMLDEIENQLMVYDHSKGFVPADEFMRTAKVGVQGDNIHRVVFIPQPDMEQKTSWTALSRSAPVDGKPYYTLIAQVTLGGSFPVKINDEKLPTHGEELFSVEMIDGSDEELTVVVAHPDGTHETVALVRDKSADVEVGDETYNLSYGTSKIALDQPTETNKATIIVSWRPAKDESPDENATKE